MHDFTRDNRTIEDTDQKRKRLRRVPTEEILEHLAQRFECADLTHQEGRRGSAS